MRVCVSAGGQAGECARLCVFLFVLKRGLGWAHVFGARFQSSRATYQKVDTLVYLFLCTLVTTREVQCRKGYIRRCEQQLGIGLSSAPVVCGIDI